MADRHEPDARPRARGLVVPADAPPKLARATEVAADALVLDLDAEAALPDPRPAPEEAGGQRRRRGGKGGRSSKGGRGAEFGRGAEGGRGAAGALRSMRDGPDQAAARRTIVDALRDLDFGERLVSVRISAIAARHAYRDLVEVVEGAGELLDAIALPRVESPGEIELVDHLLRMIEESFGIEHQIAIEAQVETAAGLTLIDEIAGASPRLEALVLGHRALSASLGSPQPVGAAGNDAGTTGGTDGALDPSSPLHWARARLLVAARAGELQAIEEPAADVSSEVLREVCRTAQRTGLDGLRVAHPDHLSLIAR